MAANASSSLSGLESIMAGAFAGCVTRSATSPLDVLKIIFQVQGASLRHVIERLYTTEGVRGFWKGNLAGCCRLGPYSGVKFYIFDSLQSSFSETGHRPSNVHRAAFGAIAGMIATVSVYPMEVVRTRIIVTTPSSSPSMGIHRTLQHIYRAEGLRGLYRGGLSGLVGSIPFEGVQFACYEYCKSLALERKADGESLGPIDYLGIGSLSGAVAQTISYPFDSVKKRLQVQELGQKRYNGMLDCFRKVVAEEGAMALFRGTLPNMVRIVPYSAVMFTTYEAAKKFLMESA
ncbi:hypothetical protein SPRG_12832 [Saprolegnia parasitica CBS 223.65]|uniref:Mitochondrial carrier protein n=1 Tax=Saprolegnia parasitica (strain CBS 223.65) TaxID=695850 RepID=A0A067C5X8_SAPPC|nr:hypothetical protein SPRG_12832 [Saprolegnia parasitica CBS 223.65]KDO21966.1 hypothetical protein SPRG_12832 [Saprolegnia parasitica CBS 223.65]|eukprot:XP_012207308.1 hypothetical protein SPRG_12832 [Saprolegnia parasitica CBS 223.65]